MPSTEVNHRDHEYDSRLHVLLQGMQERHFWYRGRHRFLLEAVHRQTGRAINEGGARHVVDLGGLRSAGFFQISTYSVLGYQVRR
jgi:hypothetical protein